MRLLLLFVLLMGFGNIYPFTVLDTLPLAFASLLSLLFALLTLVTPFTLWFLLFLKLGDIDMSTIFGPVTS